MAHLKMGDYARAGAIPKAHHIFAVALAKQDRRQEAIAELQTFFAEGSKGSDGPKALAVVGVRWAVG